MNNINKLLSSYIFFLLKEIINIIIIVQQKFGQFKKNTLTL